MDKDVAVAELQRVARALDRRYLPRSVFTEHGDVSAAAIEAAFGSWTEAVTAAGLIPLPPGGIPKAAQRRLDRPVATVPDDDLLDELIRLAKELGKRPSGNQISAKGKYSREVYQKRWGSVAKAYSAAVARLR